MEFNSLGPAVGRLGSDSSRVGANSAKVEAGGLSPLPSPLTLTTGYGHTGCMAVVGGVSYVQRSGGDGGVRRRDLLQQVRVGD